MNNTVIYKNTDEFENILFASEYVLNRIKRTKKENIKDLILLENICRNKPFCFIDYYRTITDYWDDICNYPWTYTILYNVASVKTVWKDTPIMRIKLLKILKEISDEWFKEEN